MKDALHPSHTTRVSLDASSYDEICTKCGATDTLGSWGALAKPCPVVGPVVETICPDCQKPGCNQKCPTDPARYGGL